MTQTILSQPIEAEPDVVAVRQLARRIAELLGFERQDQTRIATAVSEIARTVFSSGGGGRAEFLINSPAGGAPVFVVRLTGHGKDLGDIEGVLDGSIRSGNDAGLGLVGARRLMDRFTAASLPGNGTVIEVGQHLPKGSGKLAKTRLAEIARTVSSTAVADPLVLLREQNRELMQSLEELRRRQSETEQLSRELGDTNRGVVALYAELDERAEQLRRASELKSRFLSNMSHEFRTPLNSILALSRLLIDRVDGDLTPEQEKQVGYIRMSAEGLLELVNDLLDLAKVESGKVDVKASSFAVPELFGALRGALKPLQTNPAVELILDPDPDLPEMFTDEAKISQILRNLISNALKFTEAGEVRVTASFDPALERMIFRVRDTGIGIAPKDMSRLFEEFVQIETPLQRKVKGTGLGLPLSRNLAIVLGGDISVESVPGQGSVFALSVPHRTPVDPAKTAPAGRKRVLIVDDDVMFRYVFHQLIGGESGYEILEAVDGAQGLERAHAERPDLIVLDLNMPNGDGFWVLRELEKDRELRATPVVVSTSLAITQQLKDRLPPGIDILSKEMLSREVIAKLLRAKFEAATP